MQETTDSQGRTLSGWWPRALAFIIDGFIVGIFVFASIILIWLFTLIIGSKGDIVGAVLVIIVFLASLSYHIYLPVVWNGQTLGKKMVSIRIVRIDNQPIDTITMLKRYGLMQFVPLLAAELFSLLYIVVLPYLILDYLFPVWDNKRQCLHDKVARTQVIHEQPQIVQPQIQIQTIPPGWYDDPNNPNQFKYWNGEEWTDNISPKS